MHENTALEIKAAVLDYTAKNSYIKILKHIIRFGYHIRHNNDIALLYAVENNHADIVSQPLKSFFQ